MTQTLTDILPKILARAHMVLRKRCIMPRLVNVDYSAEAAMKGSVINVPIPAEFATEADDVSPATTGPTPSDYSPTTTPINLTNWKHKAFGLTDQEVANIDADGLFIPMAMETAVMGIANSINSSIFATYKGVYGYDGTAGTTPFASAVTAATDARKRLNKQLCPKDLRRVVLNHDAEANALALAAFRDVSQSGKDTPVIEGELGRFFGMDWYADDDVPTHTAGTIATGLAVKTSTAHAVGVKTITATTAALTGACALLLGDIIAIAGGNTTAGWTYVLTANATQASAATDVSLAIEPGLKVALTGSEAITVKASHVVNLAFRRDAFAFASRTLLDSKYGSPNMVTITDPVSGITMRLELIRQNKQTVWDLDVLWGVALIRPALAARIAG